MCFIAYKVALRQPFRYCVPPSSLYFADDGAVFPDAVFRRRGACISQLCQCWHGQAVPVSRVGRHLRAAKPWQNCGEGYAAIWFS